MIIYIVVVTLMAGIVLLAWCDNKIRDTGNRHQRCLRNTDRLERELFPEWFTSAELDDVSFAPGARWLVDRQGDLQVFTDKPRPIEYDDHGNVAYDPRCELCRRGERAPHRPIYTSMPRMIPAGFRPEQETMPPTGFEPVERSHRKVVISR